jgi:hypothetical protein
VDLIVSPAAVALNPQLGASVPALKSGDIVEAEVLQLLAGGRAKLAVADMILEVQSQVLLTPGQTVRLAVKNTPEGLRLTLIGGKDLAPGPAAGNIRPAMSPQPGQAATAPAAAIAVTGDQLNTAATSLSPAAGTALSAADASGKAASAPEPPLAAPAAGQALALAAAVQSAAARQDGLARLFADAGVAALAPGLPPALRAAAAELLAQRPVLDASLSGADIKQALDRSGLLLESRLAAAALDPGGSPVSASGDLKAALLVFRSLLKTWLDGADGSGESGAAAAKAGGVGLPAVPAPSIAAEPPLQGQSGTLARPGPSLGAAGQAAAERSTTPSAAPPPPYRGAPTAAQPAVAPSISPDSSPSGIAKVLLRDSDAALARQTLLQAASLPDPSDSAHAAASTARWAFEVPFAAPQGTAVAQFEIARDGRHAPAEGIKAVWRARFSLDVEPIGPVHAQIALTGARAAVTLWAERADTSARLRDNAARLADALRQAELDPGEVVVRSGAPPRAAATSGRFLDRAS